MVKVSNYEGSISNLFKKITVGFDPFNLKDRESPDSRWLKNAIDKQNKTAGSEIPDSSIKTLEK